MVKRKKLSFKEQVEKDMPEFANEVSGLSEEQLNNRLAQLAKDSDAVNEAKKADEGLEVAKAEVTALAAPYKDALSALKVKTKYIIGLLKEGH